jgi:hypothetical protein
MLDSLRVGQTVTRTISIVNDGKSSLTVGSATTDIDDLRVAFPGQTVSEDDTVKVILTFSRHLTVY